MNNMEHSNMQDFITKTVQQTVDHQNIHLLNLLNRISTKLQNLHHENEEQNEHFKEYRDTLLEISLKDFDYINPNSTVEQMNASIRRWVGTLFDKLSKASFSGYFQGLLLEQQLKVYFSKNLINNFINFIECFQAKTAFNWNQNSKGVMKAFQQHSNSALNFLMSKYPQKTNSDPDLYLSQMIPQFDERQSSLLYDTLVTSRFSFVYTQNGSYETQIKQFLNLLLQQTKAKRAKFILQMKSNFIITKEFSNEYEQVWNVVGSKLSQTTKMFSEQQINNPGIQIKSSDLLRIIIKWIQYLYEDIKNSKVKIGQRINGFIRKEKSQRSQQDVLKRSNSLPVVDLGLSMRQKNQLASAIQSEFKQKIFVIENNHSSKLNSLLSSLTKFISENRQTFQYIDAIQFRTSLFSHIVSQSVSNLAVAFLSHLIHILKRAISAASKIDEDLAGISLMRFGVMDLFRAKCNGTRQQILKVYNNLKNNSQFKIIRVKNRLKTGNKDFLINLQYKQSFLLCQLQLYVNSSGDGDKKQQSLQHFSHFLYQLQRSRYGALSEAAIICSNLYSPVSYFRKTLVQLNNKQPTRHYPYSLYPEYNNGSFKSHKFTNNRNDFSFICHSCYRYFNAYSTFLDVLTHQDSKQNICGQCVLELLGEQKSTQCILGDKMGQYFKQINQNQQFQQQDYIIIVNKTYTRKLIALKYYNCYKFFCPVFVDHHPNKFYQLKDIKNLSKNSYMFILNKQKLNLLRSISKQTLFSKQIKQMIHLSIFNEDDVNSTKSEEVQEKYIPMLPINQDINLVDKDQLLISCSNHGNSVLVIDSIGKTDPIYSYLQAKRDNVLQQHVKSKVDTWVAEELMLTSSHIQQIIDKNPGVVMRRIRFQNNLFQNFNIRLRVLQQLNLRSNKFQKLNFDQLPLICLSTLDVSFNKITEVINTRSFLVPRLKNLNISHNEISNIHLQVGSLPSLVKVNISNNPLSKLSFQVGFEFKHLTHLQIQQTLLQTLDLSGTIATKLKSLILNGNTLLQFIDLPSLQKIEQIKTSRCLKLKQIVFNNYAVKQLKHLDLSHCNFETFIQGHEFPDLEILLINSNKIINLDLSKSHLTSLKQLNASNNNIKTVFLYKYSKSLQKIYLQKNYIEKFDVESFGLNALIQINLEQNLIMDLNIGPSNTLKKVQLKLNPGLISSLFKLDSTQIPFIQHLTLGINPKTKSYVEWIFMNLTEETKQKFITRLLKFKETLSDKTKLLQQNNLPEDFKQLKYFINLIKKMQLDFHIEEKQQYIKKYVTSLYRSANPGDDFSEFMISPLMNTLNFDFNELSSNHDYIRQSLTQHQNSQMHHTFNPCTSFTNLQNYWKGFDEISQKFPSQILKNDFSLQNRLLNSNLNQFYMKNNQYNSNKNDNYQNINQNDNKISTTAQQSRNQKPNSSFPQIQPKLKNIVYTNQHPPTTVNVQTFYPYPTYNQVYSPFKIQTQPLITKIFKHYPPNIPTNNMQRSYSSYLTIMPNNKGDLTQRQSTLKPNSSYSHFQVIFPNQQTAPPSSDQNIPQKKEKLKKKKDKSQSKQKYFQQKHASKFSSKPLIIPKLKFKKQKQ